MFDIILVNIVFFKNKRPRACKFLSNGLLCFFLKKKNKELLFLIYLRGKENMAIIGPQAL